MNRRILSCLLIAAGTCFGQTATTTLAPQVTKIYRLHYAQANQIGELLTGRSAFIKPDNALHALVVTARPEQQAEVEQLIRELDQPSSTQGQKDVEVTVHVLVASETSAATHLPLAPAMKPVIEQLKGVFPYSNYQELGTILLRSREGQVANTSGVIKNPTQSGDAKAFPYGVVFKATVDAQQRRIHFDSFRLFISISPQDSSRRAAFETSLDATENEKVVVGKSNIDDGSSAIFAVVTARVP